MSYSDHIRHVLTCEEVLALLAEGEQLKAERDAAIADAARLRHGMNEVRALLSGLREEAEDGLIGGYVPDVEAYVAERLEGIADRIDAILNGK